jgi:hypothetical protein
MKNTIAFCLCISLATTAVAQDTSKPAITVSGYVETYYQYDANNPVNNQRPAFVYSHNRNNEVTLNMGMVKLGYQYKQVRANLALAAGTYNNANYAAEPGVLKNIYEANIGLQLSRKHNLWLDAGIFASHIGFESAIGKDCRTLTRSILADNSPYYESGIKLGYTSDNGKWFLSALLLNGWQRIQRVDGNTTPAFGTQVTYKPSSKLTLNSSTFIGNDKPDSIRQMRYFHNLYGILQLGKHTELTIGLDAGMEQKSKGSSDVNVWYSPVVIARYAATAKTAVALRAEYYKDKSGVIVATPMPYGFATWGFSANFDYAITGNVLWRIEAKNYYSQQAAFEKRNGTWVNSNTSFATALAISL